MTKTTPNPRLIIVLGMHRSGTSAVTGCLQYMGVSLGSNLLPAQELVNARGFWEDIGVVELHEQLYAELGFSWDDPRALPEGWEASEAGVAARRQIRHLLEEMDAGAISGLKDPRMCRFYSLWKSELDALGISPLVIIPLRKPQFVAASLARRDGISPDKSALLYLRHLLEAEYSSRDNQRVFVDFESLLGEPRQLAEPVLDYLGERSVDYDGLHDFLDPALVHGGADEQDCASPLFALSRRLYCALTQTDLDTDELSQIALEVSDTASVAEEILLEEHISTLNARVSSREARIVDIEKNMREQVGYREKLIAEIESNLKDVERNAQEQIVYRDSLVEEFERQLGEVRSNATEQIAYRDKLVKELENLKADVEKNADEQIRYRDEQVRDRDEQLNLYTERVAELEQKVGIYEGERRSPIALLKQLARVVMRKA